MIRTTMNESPLLPPHLWFNPIQLILNTDLYVCSIYIITPLFIITIIVVHF